MNLSIPELVEVPEKLENMGSAAHGERERRPVVPQVLAEGVPVPPLPALVPAWRGGSDGVGRKRGKESER